MQSDSTRTFRLEARAALLRRGSSLRDKKSITAGIAVMAFSVAVQGA